MKVPLHEYRRLRIIERNLLQSDPHLATMLAIFTKLNVGEAVTSEQAHRPGKRAGHILAALAGGHRLFS